MQVWPTIWMMLFIFFVRKYIQRVWSFIRCENTHLGVMDRASSSNTAKQAYMFTADRMSAWWKTELDEKLDIHVHEHANHAYNTALAKQRSHIVKTEIQTHSNVHGKRVEKFRAPSVSHTTSSHHNALRHIARRTWLVIRWPVQYSLL